MFKRFYPDIYIDSAYDIDYEGLYNKGYRGIIFDIDNTLVEHGAPVTKKCSDLFDSLRAIGFAALLTYLDPHASASGFTRGSLLCLRDFILIYILIQLRHRL